MRRRPVPRLSADARARLQTALVLSALVGVATGLVVALIDTIIVDWTWGPLSRRGDWWIALLPLAAVGVSSLILQMNRERSTETTEEYLRVFHDPEGRVRLASVPFRLAASIATIGLGGSMGLEGPSIYAGSAIGDAVERRFARRLSDRDRKVLLTAGAAAGIAAIFKAPLTGIVFALEVPYRDDLARRALVPAMVAAASSYVVFASLIGTRPLFPISAAPLRLADLGGAVVVGIGCGIGARIFVALHRALGAAARRVPYALRPLAGGAIVAAMGGISIALFSRPFALGPGYEPILRAARGSIGPGLVMALLAIKMLATSATAAGNGVGGLFFPSVMMGAALGGALGHVVPGPASLFAVVGIAAFLGGAYKVPLAGVAFVAETTGAPGYVIPGLIAAAIAYLASGDTSLSHRQRARRVIDVGSRLDMHVSDAMSREWIEVPPDATLHELATRYAIAARSRTMVVATDGRYVGMVTLGSLGDVPQEAWPTTPVREILTREHPTLRAPQHLNDALAAMRGAGVERAAVLDGETISGVLSTGDVIRIENVLQEIDQEAREAGDDAG